RVLEIGCDDGYCALALARLGYIVTAFDNSAIKIEKIRSHTNENGINTFKTVSRNRFNDSGNARTRYK
ncbi:MAG: class I SAM-dependent methyltransferase, partial [Selenomonadaceae bacterium]|nr:class I SAM-dependent methyltransferase [Selenomonadaceae bacterium]